MRSVRPVVLPFGYCGIQDHVIARAGPVPEEIGVKRYRLFSPMASAMCLQLAVLALRLVQAAQRLARIQTLALQS